MEGIINIGGQIGSTELIKGVELIDIVSQVKAQPLATSYKVLINSQGGVVDTGFAIHDYLKSLQLPIVTVGNTLVASIATVIFMAGDSRILNEGTRFMIHLPQGDVQGNANEIEAYAESVRKAEKRMIDFYKKAINTTDEAIQPMLANETWLTNDQAIALGFSTRTPQPILAVAYFTNNLNTNTKMTEADKSWIETLFAPIKALITKPILAITVTDAEGKVIEFADLVEGDIPKVDDKATIDGQPAEGDSLQVDGTTFVFVAGSLTEIKEAVEDSPADSEETVALKAELEALKAEIASVTASYSASIVTLKKQITSKFEADEKKDAKKDEEKITKRQFLK